MTIFQKFVNKLVMQPAPKCKVCEQNEEFCNCINGNRKRNVNNSYSYAQYYSQFIEPPQKKNRRDIIEQASQQALMWILNYMLIHQLNKHISSAQQSHKFLKLIIVMAFLTFSTTALESSNGRIVLVFFLLLINMLLYINIQSI